GGDIDEGDDEAGNGVAAHEFGGAVHIAEEGAFAFEFGAALLGSVLVDQASRKVGVDGHLLAGHGVEAEAGGHFGDTARTLGDDDEVHDHEDDEDHRADDEIAAGDEIAESLNDVAGSGGTVMTLGENEA